jgi:hypothetical protein
MSLPRSRSRNRSTNPQNKPQLKATQKRNSRSEGLRQSGKPRVDRPHGGGGLSAGARRTVCKNRADHPKMPPEPPLPCLNNELSEPYPQTIHAEKTVRTLLADRPANFEQPKTPDKTYRNEETQELMKNMMNTWSAGSSRTVREHLADCPPRGQSSPNSKTQTRLHLSVHGSPKWLKLLR